MIVASVRRESRMASALASRSPETSVMSEASIATSVPVPIARPRSACASAGRVVDAVADHRDDAALVLQTADDLGLVGGQDVGDHLVDPDLGRDGAGRRGVVAGQQHRPQPERA